MNRASIGVQDFDDDIQKTIGRIQSYDITRDAAAKSAPAAWPASTPTSFTACRTRPGRG